MKGVFMNDFRQQIQEEVNKNFDFFKKELPQLMMGHLGQYALLKNASIVEFFDSFNDANKYAKLAFTDRMYSIQKVTNRIVRLGILETQLCLSSACKS
jgi:hypothetical protein